MLIIKSLYYLKTIVALFTYIFTESMITIIFIPSYADADIWTKYCGLHYQFVDKCSGNI